MYTKCPGLGCGGPPISESMLKAVVLPRGRCITMKGDDGLNAALIGGPPGK